MSVPRWAAAIRALHCFAADPVALGGLHLRARASDARRLWLDRLLARLGPVGRLHPDTADEVLLGGLDLEAALRTGEARHRDGLVDRHDTLLLTMGERCTPTLAGRLAQAIDAGRTGLIALDEGIGAEEGLPPALSDRMALHVDLDGLRAADAELLTPLEDSAALDEGVARSRLVALAQALGIPSLRAPGQALRVARLSADLDGRDAMTEADIAFATATVLMPRATQLPQPQDEGDEAEAPPDPPPDTPQDAEPDTLPPEGAELLLEAALAQLPPDLLARIAAGNIPRAAGTGAGAARKGNRRGRPLPSRPGRPDGRARIDLPATLRAAAPWQRLRGGGPGQRVRIRTTDIRLKRFEVKSDRLVIFAVDASGSAAFARLAEAKGAVELLLAEAYARRDHVALIAFRGEDAQLLLPPTRSLLRTKRALAGLPGGGGTPLAAGLREGLELAHHARGRGMDPALVLLTDGRPNIALTGEADRPAALRDAEALATAIRARALPGLVIDTGNRPAPALAELAARMGATCLPLPRADARRVSRAVADAL